MGQESYTLGLQPCLLTMYDGTLLAPAHHRVKDSILEEFPLTSLGASQRATSIAWCTPRDAVLITFVGSSGFEMRSGYGSV